MANKVFGKKGSAQRSLAKNLIIAISAIIVLTIIEFVIVLKPSVTSKIAEVNLSFDDITYLVKKGLLFSIVNIILVSVILIRIYTKKLLTPISEINEATKKVAEGNYNIVLETKRKDEIGELTENFNQMVKVLKSTEKLQNEFIDNVSHEIKTPITSIEGFAKLLDDDSLQKKDRKEYIGIIVEEAERLSNLTGEILKLSKLHNQERITNKQEFMVSEQIRKAISVLEPKWAAKNLKINICLEEKIFYGDEDLIFQVWMNLIDNAIKFSNKDGKIDIKLYQDKDKIIVNIKDYGKGMSEDEIEKVFDRFYQIDKSHSEEGTGLGLAIVKRILELSDGDIKIKSKEGKGTSIIVMLPVIQVKDNKVYIS